MMSGANNIKTREVPGEFFTYRSVLREVIRVVHDTTEYTDRWPDFRPLGEALQRGDLEAAKDATGILYRQVNATTQVALRVRVALREVAAQLEPDVVENFTNRKRGIQASRS